MLQNDWTCHKCYFYDDARTVYVYACIFTKGRPEGRGSSFHPALPSHTKNGTNWPWVQFCGKDSVVWELDQIFWAQSHDPEPLTLAQPPESRALS